MDLVGHPASQHDERALGLVLRNHVSGLAHGHEGKVGRSVRLVGGDVPVNHACPKKRDRDKEVKKKKEKKKKEKRKTKSKQSQHKPIELFIIQGCHTFATAICAGEWGGMVSLLASIHSTQSPAVIDHLPSRPSVTTQSAKGIEKESWE
jgi:hypothetical protein